MEIYRYKGAFLRFSNKNSITKTKLRIINYRGLEKLGLKL